MTRWPGPGHQSDPLHPAFQSRRPLWLSVALGAVGLAVLLGLVAYALLA